MQRLNSVLGAVDGKEHTVPCVDCGRETTCTALAWEMGRLFSYQLRDRGESEITRNEIAKCDKCYRVWQRNCERNAAREYLRAAKRAAEREHAALNRGMDL